MSAFVLFRNGGKSDENALSRFFRQSSSNGQGNVQTGGMLVSQHSSPNRSVDLAIGDLIIQYQDYCFPTYIDAITTVTTTTNTSGNSRIDAIVAYVDLTVVSSASNNNPGALKFVAVAGTPSGSPVAPNGTTIQAAVGAGNPYYVLATVLLANNYTQIVNANITDGRTQYQVGASQSGKLQSIQSTTTLTNSTTSSASDVELMSITFMPTATANFLVLVNLIWQQSNAGGQCMADLQLDGAVQGNNPAMEMDSFTNENGKYAPAMAQIYMPSVSNSSHKVSVNFRAPSGTGTVTVLNAQLTIIVFNA